MALYVNDDGIPVTTQSMVKTFLTCPREAYYKYYLRLKPKTISKPLTRGSWIHECLEAHYKGFSWRSAHNRWVNEYNRMSWEDRQELGDLPSEIRQLLTSYFWHYENDPWEVIASEMEVERMLPCDHLFRGKVDFIVKDGEDSVWVGDHKTHKRLPDWTFRELDQQSSMYLWALQPWAESQGLTIKGFVWNYLVTEAIKEPKLTSSGDRFSRRLGKLPPTDYPTLIRTLKDTGCVDNKGFTGKLRPDEQAKVVEELRQLKQDRYNPEGTQTSPFFRREYLVKSPYQLETSVKQFCTVSEQMHGYNWEDQTSIPRNVGNCKGWQCRYKDLNIADAIRGDSELVAQLNYITHEPLSYYESEVDANA